MSKKSFSFTCSKYTMKLGDKTFWTYSTFKESLWDFEKEMKLVELFK